MQTKKEIAEKIARWTTEALDEGRAVSLVFDHATGEWSQTKPVPFAKPIPFSIRRYLAGERQIS